MHYKRKIARALSPIFPPVAGFRPRLSRFSLTQNLPKPLIRTFSLNESLDCDEFEEGLYQFHGLIELVTVFPGDRLNDIALDERHWRGSLIF